MAMPMNQATQQQVDPMQLQQMQQQAAMMERIRQLPPEEQQAAMMGMYQDYQGQEGVISEQLAQANALRGQGGPQGVQAGSQYVAASPLSHLARGVERFKGGMDANQALADKKALSEMRTKGQMDVANNQLQQPAQQPQQMQHQGIMAHRRHYT